MMNIDWKALGKQLWAACKPVILAAIGGGIVSMTTGCSNMTPSARGQTTEIVAVGVPAVAWITHTTQNETNGDGGDTTTNEQTTAVTGSIPVSVSVPLN